MSVGGGGKGDGGAHKVGRHWRRPYAYVKKEMEKKALEEEET